MSSWCWYLFVCLFVFVFHSVWDLPVHDTMSYSTETWTFSVLLDWISFKFCVLAGFLWYCSGGWKEVDVLPYYWQVGWKCKYSTQPLLTPKHEEFYLTIGLFGNWDSRLSICWYNPDWWGERHVLSTPHCNLLTGEVKVFLASYSLFSDTTLVGELGHLDKPEKIGTSKLMTW